MFHGTIYQKKPRSNWDLKKEVKENDLTKYNQFILPNTQALV